MCGHLIFPFVVIITFTPNSNYIIDKILVNTVDLTGSVVSNKLELSNITEDKDIVVTYKVIPPKTDPTYTVPTGLVGAQNKTLSTIKLPANWSWVTPSTIMSGRGTKTFAAIYTPSDLTKHNIINTNLTVSVKELLDINWTVGSNGTANIDTNKVLEGGKIVITLIPDSGYELDKIVVNSVDFTSNVVSNKLELLNVLENKNINITYKKISTGYDIIVGDNQEYTITNDTEATFKANGPYKLFKDVYVDDELVDSKNYTAKEGSTIITFKQSYLDKLSVGTHKLRVTYTDGGAATGVFKVSDVVATSKSNNNLLIYIIIALLLLLIAFLFYKRKNKE